MGNYDFHLLIAGKQIHAHERETMDVVNPANEQVLGQLPMASPEDVDSALAATQEAFSGWRKTPPAERSSILRRAAELLRERADSIASLITLEEGIQLGYAHAEVMWSADIIDWCADEGRRGYGRTIPSNVTGLTQTALRVPIGPTVAFTPWNAPALMPARKMCEALATGCTSIIKPAEEAPGAALEVGRALTDAGLPPGCINILFGDPEMISARLIQSSVTRKISFTGSVAVGRQLASMAGAQGKPMTLELGGHAPVLVFDDVDVEQVAAAVVGFKAWNSGQLCGSPTRILVQSSVYERFLEAYVEASAAIVPGNGLDESSGMGPLISQRRVASMEKFVDDAEQRGGQVLTGGRRCGEPGEGYFFPLTVVSEVDTAAMIMNEEPFGPISVVQSFESVDDAIAEANRLEFALATYAFTQSQRTAARLTDELESGQLGINSFAIVSPEVPFGGIKGSGYGKEGGIEGLDAYYTTKLVAVSAE